MSTISPPIKAKAERRRTTKLTQTMAKNKSRLPKSETSQLNEVTHPDMLSSSQSGAIGTGLVVSSGKPAATGGLAFLVGSYTMMSALIYLVLPVLYTYLLCQPCILYTRVNRDPCWGFIRHYIPVWKPLLLFRYLLLVFRE
jgi:amino acid permease